jgi:hypothetical protein
MAPTSHFQNDQHALAAGALAGVLLSHDIKFEFIFDDEGNYTNQIIVLLDDLDDLNVPWRLPITIGAPQT